MRPPAFARKAFQAVQRMKAEDPVLLDLRKLSALFDYFLICSASTARQRRSIADAVVEELSAERLQPRHRSGLAEGGWTLLDFGDLVVHVLSHDLRTFYDLEGLWADAFRIAPEEMKNPTPDEDTR